MESLNIKNFSIIRLEQIYPFPYEIFKEELVNYKDAEIIWVQEEPKNMGAWGFIRSRIESVMLEACVKQQELYYVGRSPAASPAAGSLPRHIINQENMRHALKSAARAQTKSEVCQNGTPSVFPKSVETSRNRIVVSIESTTETSKTRICEHVVLTMDSSA